jgi:hypothetical protein
MDFGAHFAIGPPSVPASAHETCEMALAHTISNKAEAAYRRGAQLEKRRDLMEAWARFCDGGGPTSGGVINKRVAAGIS